MEEKICQVCGKPITSKRATVACSDECRRYRRTEQVKAHLARRKEEDPEKFKAYHRERTSRWVKKHLEESKRYQIEWRKNHPEKVKAYAKKAREKMKSSRS